MSLRDQRAETTDNEHDAAITAAEHRLGRNLTAGEKRIVLGCAYRRKRHGTQVPRVQRILRGASIRRDGLLRAELPRGSARASTLGAHRQAGRRLLDLARESRARLWDDPPRRARSIRPSLHLRAATRPYPGGEPPAPHLQSAGLRQPRSSRLAASERTPQGGFVERTEDPLRAWTSLR